MSEAVAPAFDLGALKAMLDDSMTAQLAPLREEIATLKAKVAEQDTMIPRFKPMERPKQTQVKSPKEQLAALVAGQELGGMRQLIVTQNGRPMESGALKALFDQYQPRFAIGQSVQINPEAHRRGWREGMLWQELLAKEPKNPDGFGEVVEICPFSWRGWSYRVKVEGHTPSLGMEFEESELLGA